MNFKSRSAKNKDFSLPDGALNDFEKSLNEHIPEFENGMYERIAVEQSNGKLPSILLHEKSGEIVDLNSTSAGDGGIYLLFYEEYASKTAICLLLTSLPASFIPLRRKRF